MKPLTPPDTHYLAAAEGWLELGNAAEARVELDHLPAASQAHPWALQMRWRIDAAAGSHEECARIAGKLIEILPDEPFGWVHRSYSLHELKRTREAYDFLAPVAGKFPQDFVIPYNLGCYCCQLGWLDEARKWLKQAIAIGGLPRIRQMAADDPDLRPLASEIDQLGQ
jgi:predicted Zn-dependent protease